MSASRVAQNRRPRGVDDRLAAGERAPYGRRIEHVAA
jgi:hypothetical protein